MISKVLCRRIVKLSYESWLAAVFYKIGLGCMVYNVVFSVFNLQPPV
jgi:hypothetical protein